jgi:hypothetical protein
MDNQKQTFMKEIITVIGGLLLSGIIIAQEPELPEADMENLTASVEEAPDDEDMLLRLGQFRKHPLDLNRADADELKELGWITERMIQALLLYRDLLGPLIHVNELLAVPGWEPGIIRKILPYVQIISKDVLLPVRRNDFTKRNHELLIRHSRSAGQQEKYTGSPDKILLRYRYHFSDKWQAGITAEKDAGEAFFNGAQQWGFDFYSFHLFIKKWRKFRSIALGDFTVNMGQGLIHWQRLAFGKSTDITQMKRQSAVLAPYGSSGEYNFHRGVGATVGLGAFTISGFLSFRKLSATLQSDSMDIANAFSAFRTSGYHRTGNEIAARNKLKQLAEGMVIQYRKKNFTAAFNQVTHFFSLPLQKEERPSNLYAMRGKNWYNASLDYSWLFRQVHIFGEAAISKSGGTAFLQSMLISIDSRADVSLQWRRLSPGYQSVTGRAITENSQPTNERGYLMAVNLRLFSRLKWDGYVDFYSFPWLGYYADAPARGRDYQFTLHYSPRKQIEMYLRYRSEEKERNEGGEISNKLAVNKRNSWRFHIDYMISGTLRLRQRIEWVRFQKDYQFDAHGFLYYADISWKSLGPVSLSVRWQVFDTDSYDTRLYAFEQDVSYSYSLPASYGKGYRYIVLTKYVISRHLSAWLRWSKTGSTWLAGEEPVYANDSVVRSSDIRLQLMLDF